MECAVLLTLNWQKACEWHSFNKGLHTNKALKMADFNINPDFGTEGKK